MIQGPEINVVGNLVQLISVLIGAGAGSYFGLKGALNGIRQTTSDTNRVIHKTANKMERLDWALEEHSKDMERYVQELKDMNRGAK